MRRWSAAAAIVAAVLLTAPVGAQDRRAFPDPTTLVGRGSTIGVRARDLSEDELKKARLESSGGVYVDDVVRDSPAERAGFKSGDIVTTFDGERVRSVRTFARLVAETPPQRSVKVTIVRDGSQRTLDVTPEAGVNALTRDLTRILPRNLPQLRSLPRLPSPLPRFDIVPPPQRLGVTLGVVQDQLADYFGVSAGALVSSVDRDSAAFRGGLKAGDVITAVDRRPVRTPGDVSDAVRAAAPGATLHLTVMRDRKEISLDVTVPNAVPAPRPNGPVRDSGRLPI